MEKNNNKINQFKKFVEHIITRDDTLFEKLTKTKEHIYFLVKDESNHVHNTKFTKEDFLSKLNPKKRKRYKKAIKAAFNLRRPYVNVDKALKKKYQNFYKKDTMTGKLVYTPSKTSDKGVLKSMKTLKGSLVIIEEETKKFQKNYNKIQSDPVTESERLEMPEIDCDLLDIMQLDLNTFDNSITSLYNVIF